MGDNRKLQVFDSWLHKYLCRIAGYGYANMTWNLKGMFTKEEIIEILTNFYPNEEKDVIIREVEKEMSRK